MSSRHPVRPSYGWLLLLVVLAFGVAPVVSAETTTLDGWIEVAEEDEEGNVTAVYVDDPSQGWFLVAEGQHQAELIGMVGERVIVEGAVEDIEGDETYRLIRVTSFRLFDADDEDEPEDQ